MPLDRSYDGLVQSTGKDVTDQQDPVIHILPGLSDVLCGYAQATCTYGVDDEGRIDIIRRDRVTTYCPAASPLSWWDLEGPGPLELTEAASAVSNLSILLAAAEEESGGSESQSRTGLCMRQVGNVFRIPDLKITQNKYLMEKERT